MGIKQLPVLPAGARAILLAQVGQLAGVLGTALGRLSNTSQASGCSGHGHPKTCTLLSEIGAALQSAQREILRAADTLATTVRVLGGLVAILGGSGVCRTGGWDVTSTAGGSLGSMWVQPSSQLGQEEPSPLLANLLQLFGRFSLVLGWWHPGVPAPRWDLTAAVCVSRRFPRKSLSSPQTGATGCWRRGHWPQGTSARTGRGAACPAVGAGS